MAQLYYDRYPFILEWSNTQGKTALHVAALKGNEELVRVSSAAAAIIPSDSTVVFFSCCVTRERIVTLQTISETHLSTSEFLSSPLAFI